MKNKLEIKELKIEVDKVDGVFYGWTGNISYTRDILTLTTSCNGIVKKFVDSAVNGKSSFNALVRIKQRVQDSCKKNKC